MHRIYYSIPILICTLVAWWQGPFLATTFAFQEGEGLPGNNFRRERPSQTVPVPSSHSPELTSRDDKIIRAEGALTSPVSDVSVPSRMSGPLAEIYVVETQEVALGDLLAKLDTTMSMLQVESSRVQLDAAMAKASDDVAVRYAEKSFSVAHKEMEINADLARKGAGTRQEAERSKLAAEQADLQIERSRHDLDVAKKEAMVEEYNVRAAETNLARHDIKSPLNGNVVKIFKQPGEWVNEGEVVFRVIQMDRMRVEGLIELNMYSPNDIFGKPVTVVMNTAGRQEVFEGKVVMVNLETTNGKSYTVRAEVENRRVGRDLWLLLSGVSVTLHIHLQ